MEDSTATPALPMIPKKAAFITQKGDIGSKLQHRDKPDLDILLKGQTSQATLLLRKRNELREVSEALILKKEEFKKRMEECNYKMADFESKLAKHREEKVRFEQFIQDNLAKKQRSELKLKNEHKLYEEKCKQLQQLADKMAEMELQVKELSLEIVEKRRYKEFLDRCVGESGRLGYEEVNDILNRYRTLRESNQDLMLHVAKQEEEADSIRTKLFEFRVEKENQILIGNNQCQAQREALDRIRQEVSSEEEKKDSLEDKKKDLSRELSEVTSSIKNMYQRCQSTIKSKQLFVSHPRDTGVLTAELLDDYLETIMARIVDLKEIKKEFNS